jgi:hypothetical protein
MNKGFADLRLRPLGHAADICEHSNVQIGGLIKLPPKTTKSTGCGFHLSGRRDSNPRHQPWQGCALPAELLPHVVHFCKELLKKRCKYKFLFLFLQESKIYLMPKITTLLFFSRPLAVELFAILKLEPLSTTFNFDKLTPLRRR